MRTMEATAPALLRRLNLRETRSSRAAVSIVVASVLLLVIVWLGLEQALSLTGNDPLVLAPAELLEQAASLGTAILPWALIAAGVAVVLLGIALLAAAVLPGTKARHVLENSRSAVVVDSEVLAAAVSRTARTVARLAPEQVASRVGRTRIEVDIRPDAGRTVDTNAIREAVERDVKSYRLRRSPAIMLSTGLQGTRGAVGI
ncbi:hypothetical protein [Arthrobacter psychrolactophilus]|nr:hypothetical protein [Arthrobacter psychrolactophilus]